MAHPEHVDIVKQGMKAIRKWRETNAEAILNLSDANFSGADLWLAKLRDANLSGAKLSKANFSDADLSNANLSDADLSFANLRFANILNANLSGAKLLYANLSEAKLSSADFSEADLSNANLTWANLSEANLQGANLREANLHEADLSKANLSDADLSKANLSGADLSGADLSDADLSGADLSGAKLELTQLHGAYLREAELKEVARMIQRMTLRSTVKELWGAMWPVLLAVLWVLFACWFVYNQTGNPLNDFALIRGAETAPGFIVDTWEDVLDDGHRGVRWYYGYEYRYHAADGREYSQVKHRSGQLKDEFSDLNEPVPIEVEYLPDNPSVSRIKGSGCQSVTEWLWRNVGRVILLAMLVAPSLVFFRNGFRDIKKLTCG